MLSHSAQALGFRIWQPYAANQKRKQSCHTSHTLTGDDSASSALEMTSRYHWEKFSERGVIGACERWRK